MVQIDMKMPESCYQCSFCNNDGGCNIICWAGCFVFGNNETKYRHQRHEKCPLREQESIISRPLKCVEAGCGAKCSIINFEDYSQDPYNCPSYSSCNLNSILDRIGFEIENKETIFSVTSHHRGDLGDHVEWSDKLIRESEVLEILDKYKED